MNQLLTGIQSYITSWQTPLAVVAIMVAAYMWVRGHHFAACLEILAALAILFTATQIAGQVGL
jgi:type IV secretory pathway VirB2 component (pilin)